MCVSLCEKPLMSRNHFWHSISKIKKKRKNSNFQYSFLSFKTVFFYWFILVTIPYNILLESYHGGIRTGIGRAHYYTLSNERLSNIQLSERHESSTLIKLQVILYTVCREKACIKSVCMYENSILDRCVCVVCDR